MKMEYMLYTLQQSIKIGKKKYFNLTLKFHLKKEQIGKIFGKIFYNLKIAFWNQCNGSVG